MKMVDDAVLNAALTQVANAIRAKTGSQASMTFPNGMVSAIQGYSPTEASPLTVTENGTYTASGGIVGYSPVTVNVEGGASSFDELEDRPSYDGTEMTSETSIPKVPTKTSELTNDAGYIDGTYHDSSKQDVIQDLATIRSGAAAGATAYQKPATGIPKTHLVQSFQDEIDSKIGSDNTGTTGQFLEKTEDGAEWKSVTVAGVAADLIWKRTTKSECPTYTNAAPTESGKSWSDYSFFLIFYASAFGSGAVYDSDIVSTFALKGALLRIAPQGYDPNSSGNDYWRTIKITDSGMTLRNSSGTAISNFCAPRAIYGIRGSTMANPWPL